MAPPTGKNPPPLAAPVAKLFFPPSASLKRDLGSTRPALLQKIVYAGSNSPSFQRAAEDVRILAETSSDVKQVERLTQRIGREWHEERDATTAAWLARPLAEREETPPPATPPPVAVVEMDGGRLQIRTAGDETPTGATAAVAAAAAAPSPALATPPPTRPRPPRRPQPTTRPTSSVPPNTGVKTRWAVCSACPASQAPSIPVR